MATQKFVRTVHLPASAEEVFDWHERPGAFNRLTPPWEAVKVLDHTGGIKDGAKVDLQIGMLGPIKQRWKISHQAYEYGKQFQDVQDEGPFATYAHTHRMHDNGGKTSTLEDEIEYSLPLGPLGNLFGDPFVKAKFERLFRYRHAVTRNDLVLHQQFRDHPRLNVAITGSSGMLGSALRHFLTTGGHKVTRVVREPVDDGNTVLWDPKQEQFNPAALAGVDAVVHLAGENIGESRWSEARKQRILESRIKGTRLLAETLAAMPEPPKVLISASAIGVYGDRGDEWLNEASTTGDDFLSEVVQAWESALQPAIDAGIRVVKLRFGVILSLAGGMMSRLHLPYQMGVGGVVGSGDQYLSWIAIDDVIGIINHALLNEQVSGLYNAVAPQPVTNRAFTKTMGHVMNRPTIFPLPGFVVKLVFGEMGESLLLYGQRVSSQKLQQTGYKFLYPELESALRHVLGRPGAASSASYAEDLARATM